MIICDSREKKNGHVLSYFEKHGIEYKTIKMDTADYMRLENRTLLIDRKQNLSEVCTNLRSPDSSRFWREVRRSYYEKSKLIFLVEHGGQIKSLPDVAKWNNKYSSVSGRMLMDSMFQVVMSYGVEWEFCDKRSTGKRIIELLGGD